MPLGAGGGGRQGEGKGRALFLPHPGSQSTLPLEQGSFTNRTEEGPQSPTLLSNREHMANALWRDKPVDWRVQGQAPGWSRGSRGSTVDEQEAWGSARRGTPAGVAQWIECWPPSQRLTGSIPSQGTCLGCGPGPWCWED